MDQDKVNVTMAKVASYIGEMQPQLDKQAEDRMRFVKRARQAAGALVSRGLLPADRVDAFVDKVAEDQVGIWAFVEKLAELIPVDTLGGPSPETFADGKPLDPFEKLAVYGDARYDDSKQSGMID